MAKLYYWNTKFTFGKYRGMTVREVFYKDIFYLMWVDDNVDFVYFSYDIEKELYPQSNTQLRRQPSKTKSSKTSLLKKIYRFIKRLIIWYIILFFVGRLVIYIRNHPELLEIISNFFKGK